MQEFFKTTTVNHLNQFNGRKVELSIIDNSEITTTFTYNCFTWEQENDTLSLIDLKEKDSITTLPYSDVQEVNYTSEDVYSDVIGIVCGDKRISICTLEKKPIIPTCDKCKCELDEYSHVWYVNQTAGYNSQRDGSRVSVKVCNSCFEKMFGSILPSPYEDIYDSYDDFLS